MNGPCYALLSLVPRGPASTEGPEWGLIREGPSSGPLSLAPVSAKELKERTNQGVL